MPASVLASPSATIAVLERHGLYTRKALGQHFLVDDNTVRRTLELARLSGEETVLEVGPGIGTLTVALCVAAGAVVAVERDDRLLPALAETTTACPRLAVVHADALTVSAEALSAPFGRPEALVANLPYQVAATLVLRFFELIPTLQQATVMVQAEVADRMAARPGTKAYGAYTVKLRMLAEPTGRFAVAPGCFLPPPRVDSAVIRLDRRESATGPAERAALSRVVDAAFAQRRKTLRNSLRATLDLTDQAVDEALRVTRIDGSVRAETLTPDAFVALARAISQD